MRKVIIPIMCCSLLMASTSSCGLAEWAVMNDPDANMSTKGAVVGAVSGANTGAFIGSLTGHSYHSSRDNSLIGAAIGAVAGAAIGAAVGDNIDKKQQPRAYEAEIYSPNEVYDMQRRSHALGDNCIYFGQSKTKIDKSAKQVLDRVAVQLRNDPSACVEIYGHTDNFGSHNDRRRISVERAQVVKAYLMKKGVPASQIFCKGCADQYPLADNNTANGRAVNRRVELRVVKNVNTRPDYSRQNELTIPYNKIPSGKSPQSEPLPDYEYGNSNVSE